MCTFPSKFNPDNKCFLLFSLCFIHLLCHNRIKSNKKTNEMCVDLYCVRFPCVDLSSIFVPDTIHFRYSGTAYASSHLYCFVSQCHFFVHSFVYLFVWNLHSEKTLSVMENHLFVYLRCHCNVKREISR